eukprot:TRINITY_DN9240_c0_g1_i4.p1 TRINITY_DN9240_c0_g1~~TRINITY_DN9240_c0_g1_i4.p1  ORF type:complete len:416 (-),score=42.65 TRINITY_DN9240_c0_g1_i4:643-1866(-)
MAVLNYTTGGSGFVARYVVYLLIFILGQSYLLFCMYASRYLNAPTGVQREPVVVMYVFSNTDPEYAENLNFFVREAVRPDDGIDYIFVIQYADDIPEVQHLPNLPLNAKYVYHPNAGYDWGTYGWIIDEKIINIDEYKYFLFVNSSVRGPYMPAYIKPIARWVDLFISKLNDQVKLVGPTINCEISHDGEGMTRTNPHVQSYAMATDRIGLQVMIDDGSVFKTYESFQDTVFYSEVGSTLSILKAGYTIDSFMMRYQNVDWRDPDQWYCNQQINPTGLFSYDGISIHPLEALFVKVKDKFAFNRWSNLHMAFKYDDWMQQSGNYKRQAISTNEWTDDPAAVKVPLILALERRGSECFDVDFYRTVNWDLPDWTDDMFFTHFSQAGQFEGRKYKFTCPANYTGVLHTF